MTTTILTLFTLTVALGVAFSRVRVAYRRRTPIDVDRYVARDEVEVLRGHGPGPEHQLDAAADRRIRMLTNRALIEQAKRGERDG